MKLYKLYERNEKETNNENKLLEVLKFIENLFIFLWL